jgi:Cytochrome P460
MPESLGRALAPLRWTCTRASCTSTESASSFRTNPSRYLPSCRHNIGGPITPNGLNDGHAPFPEFHSVYIAKENFRYYQENGKFPEGTVMVKELALVQGGGHSDGSTDSASGRGYFPGSLSGLDVMVKDSKRFAGTNDWGFFTFGHHAPPYEAVAKESTSQECASCHVAFVAKTDMVWVQYYPLLKTKID